MLGLRLTFALLLYLFLFNLVGLIRRDLRRSAVAESPRPGPPAVRAVAHLVVVDGQVDGLVAGARLALSADTLIGRAADCQIRISDSFVSSHHARLTLRDGGWHIADLDSTNGTLVNQQPLDGQQRLEFGDVIGIGRARLKLTP